MDNFNYALNAAPAAVPSSQPQIDHTIHLPSDVRSLICSKLEDPRVVVKLASMNRLWRSGATKYCSTKIFLIFGNIFDFTKRSPLQVFVDLWGPIKVRSNQLATVLKADLNLPVTKALQAVFDAIERKTVEELKERIKAVNLDVLTNLKYGTKERFGPPQNPLRLAVESGKIEKVRCLLEIGTHVGVAVEGHERYNGPLLKAVINRQEDILRLLLEYGASFGVTACHELDIKVIGHSVIPIPLLYQMLKVVSLEENDEVSLRCVALALRSWRDEKGPDAIRNDPWLEKFVREYIVDSSRYQIVQLLISYGVPEPKKETIDPVLFSRGVVIAVANARRGFLELWNKKGLLNYQEFRNSFGFSLADLAVQYGQFELEKDLVEKQKVPHCKREEALQALKDNFSRRAIFLEKKEIVGIGDSVSCQKCSVQRLLEIFRHYEIDLDKDCLFKGATPLCILCFSLFTYSRYDNKKLQNNLPNALATLKLIEGIIQLGCKLDLKSTYSDKVQTPRDLLNEFLKYDEIWRVPYEVTSGVESILQRYPEVKDTCTLQ